MSTHSRRARLLGAAGVSLLLAGLAAIGIAVLAQQSAPQPAAAAARPVDVLPSGRPTETVPGPGTGRTGTPTRIRGVVLPRSAPVRLRIPQLGVDVGTKRIGLNSKGEIITPPLEDEQHAYWLTTSPTPGELGPATILGHVDSAVSGPGVFFRLGELRQRQRIMVIRADGRTATFEVERVVSYRKSAFPTQEVYGNIDHAGLRLITCGGTFNEKTRSYESNIVVYAALVAVSPARQPAAQPARAHAGT